MSTLLLLLLSSPVLQRWARNAYDLRHLSAAIIEKNLKDIFLLFLVHMNWFQMKFLGISACTTFADIEKYLSSHDTFLIGRKPLGVHWELGCQMF